MTDAVRCPGCSRANPDPECPCPGFCPDTEPPPNVDAARRGALRDVIRSAFDPDPWHADGSVDAAVIEAVALLVEEMAEVSRSRKAAAADEPWKRSTPLEQLEHATIHVDTAFAAEADDQLEALDPDTGRPHLAHCALRSAFALALRRGIVRGGI